MFDFDRTNVIQFVIQKTFILKILINILIINAIIFVHLLIFALND